MNVILFENKSESASDTALRQKTSPVKDINGEIRTIVTEMLELMRAEKGVGLAGPQVGIPMRIFVTHTEKDEARVFINPAIVWTSQEQVEYEEGCLSLPGLYADVVRPERIKVQAWNEKGKAFTLSASGMLARVIQHEYDHLQGMLFIDRINESRREKIFEKMKKGRNLPAKRQRKAG